MRQTNSTSSTSTDANTSMGGSSAIARTAQSAAQPAIDQACQSAAKQADWLADSLKSAASRLEEGPLPVGSAQVEKIAERVTGAADYIRQHQKEPSVMADDLAHVARAHPAAFLGTALVAGFAATRFAKASEPTTYPQHTNRSTSSNFNRESYEQTQGVTS